MYRLFFFCILLLKATNLFSMVYDNRYLPLYWRTFSRTERRPSNFTPDLMIFTANDAWNHEEDGSFGIPEVWGGYDFCRLADAVTKLGRPNPLLGTQFQEEIGRNLLWTMKGKIQAQGVAFTYNQQITDYFSIGATWFGLHAFSRIEFEFAENNRFGFDEEQLRALNQLRRNTQDSVGLYAPKFSKGGFSDIDMYARVGNTWHYSRKFRRIDAGLRAGILIPSGLTREINNPASIPFGGNGFWGLYGCVDTELELKEDWKVGIWIRASKRFSRTKDVRLPLANEQPLFAVFPTQAKINPGDVFIASPYFLLEDLQDGFGLQGKYTLVIHNDDSVSPVQLSTEPKPTLKEVVNNSAWTAEYLTINAFYDFSRVKLKNCFAPIFSFMWDIPVQVLLAKRSSKTHRISLGISFSF